MKVNGLCTWGEFTQEDETRKSINKTRIHFTVSFTKTAFGQRPRLPWASMQTLREGCPNYCRRKGTLIKRLFDGSANFTHPPAYCSTGHSSLLKSPLSGAAHCIIRIRLDCSSRHQDKNLELLTASSGSDWTAHRIIRITPRSCSLHQNWDQTDKFSSPSTVHARVHCWNMPRIMSLP